MDFKVPLSKPDITNLEIDAVNKVLKTPHLSLGKKYIEFQDLVAKFTGVKYAVATNSGTSALHLIIRALGIKNGDEVITTPFSFIASSNCIIYEGAKPVFVDIDKQTFNIDPKLIEGAITKKTKAILAVDVFSHPAQWDELKKIAKKHKLFLIEDSAEALGSEYKKKKCGSFGDAGVFAFYPNKQITTGEGGMIVTNNKKIADLCKSMSNQGRKIGNGKWLEHVRLGYNYRLDEMSCAMGIAQMSRISEIVSKIPFYSKDAKLSWFVYVVLLSEELSKKRDYIISQMAKASIQCSNYFQPIHLQLFYKKEFGYKRGDFPVSETIGKRTLALPFFNDLSESQIDYVVDSLNKIISQIK